MSTNLAHAQPLPLHQPTARPSHIEIVTTKAQRKARPRMLYAVVTVASFFVILAAQLLLSIVVTQGAYQIDSLQYEQKVLIRTEQSLLESLSLQSSSQNLAAQAAGFGMVPNATPYSLNISDGSVFRLPGSADPTGCGGSCGLVGNTLLTDVPLVSAETAAAAAAAKTAAASAATTATATASGAAATESATAAPEPANNAIPAPVTR
ncbi:MULTISPECIES: hypothetical protein [unclassified Salinibacterium]|uniref:hypothetical protein n=1 Tax=unclassified Salinibacterium TaxID=2632331 RepID=UPI0018CF7163|nr:MULTISPECIES: hypothetical protein [unclassified Salinibacterium]MBH0054329.1 hypothetical protein [Salinibacterium sp. SWN139]MBH0083615.1 hypothetical protein [Salinibacterium sp. SWN167]